MPKESQRATIEEVEDDDDNEPQRPELPYRAVPAVQYAKRPVDSRIPPPGEKQLPAVDNRKNYEVRAPVEEDKDDAEEMVAEIFKSIEYGIPLDKLFAMSPRLLRHAKKMLSKRRVAVNVLDKLEKAVASLEPPPPPNHSMELPGGGSFMQPMSTFIQADAISARDLPFSSAPCIQQRAEGLVPQGAIVISDPVVQYLASLPDGVAPRQIFVAYADIQRVVGPDSEHLRVVYPLVHGVGELEGIVDGGSQIVSMAQATAMEMGIGWDPDINIYMQSANAQVEKSLGLAKNVAFRFEEVTLYLQVHIIRSPAYKLLLGRPFDVLAGTMIQNGTDGSQLITLTDPNTKKRSVVPTFPRGAVRQLKKVRGASAEIPEDTPAENPATASTNFQNSMN